MPGETILVVDDSPDDIEAIMHALRRARILNPVQIVTTGEESICYLKGEGVYENRNLHPFPALMLLDLKLPGRSGFDVLGWLKRQPEFKPKAVVILTGLTDLEEIRKGYELGANSFLTKPLVVEDLLNVARGLRNLVVSEFPQGFRMDLR